MTSDQRLGPAERLSLWLARGACVLVVAAVVAVLAAALGPINTDSPMSTGGGKTRPTIAAAGTPSIGPLKAQIARRRLIRPPEVKAAVKDSGAAQRLLDQLKLHGVVRMEREYVAYVEVDKRGVRAVRKGEKLLEFIVESVAPGRVVLSLQGVEVILEH